MSSISFLVYFRLPFRLVSGLSVGNSFSQKRRVEAFILNISATSVME